MTRLPGPAIMRRRRAILLAVLLLALPVGAAAEVPERSALEASVVVIGYDDHVIYRPTLARSSLTTQNQQLVPDPPACDDARRACPTSTPLPAGQWVWLDLYLEDEAGRPMEWDVSVDATGFGELEEWTSLQTDATGSGRILLPAPVGTEAYVRLLLPDQTLRLFEWQVLGAVTNATQPTVLRPQDAWVEAELEILAHAYFWVRFTSEASERSPIGAHALLYDQSFRHGDGTTLEVAAGGVAGRRGDLKLALATTPASASVDQDLIPDVLVSEGSFTVQLARTLEPGEFTSRVVLGRAGLSDFSAFTLTVFGPRDAYALRVNATGSFHALRADLAAGHEVGGPLLMPLVGAGQFRGSYSADATVPDPSLVLVGVHLPSGASGSLTVQHGEDALEREMEGGGPSASLALARMGACGGHWRLDLTSYRGSSSASAALAYGDAAPLSPFFLEALSVPTNSCSP